MITDRRLLAFDLGTKLGWAAWDPWSPPDRGYAWGRVELAGKEAIRFANAQIAMEQLFRDWLPGNERKHLRGILVLEAPSAIQRSAAQVLYGLRTCALLVAHRHCTDVVEVMPAELKKAATGRGNALKSDVWTAAVERWGPGVGSEDEADALWALEWARLNAELAVT